MPQSPNLSTGDIVADGAIKCEISPSSDFAFAASPLGERRSFTYGFITEINGPVILVRGDTQQYTTIGPNDIGLEIYEADKIIAPPGSSVSVVDMQSNTLTAQNGQVFDIPLLVLQAQSSPEGAMRHKQGVTTVDADNIAEQQGSLIAGKPTTVGIRNDTNLAVTG